MVVAMTQATFYGTCALLAAVACFVVARRVWKLPKHDEATANLLAFAVVGGLGLLCGAVAYFGEAFPK